MDYAVFQEQNSLDHPMEDAWLAGAGRHVVAVADEVTRDSYPGHSPGSEPEESGAAQAARLFCRQVVSSLEDCRVRESVEGQLRTALDSANTAIGALNRMRPRSQPRDFLDNDLYGTVGIAACLEPTESGLLVRSTLRNAPNAVDDNGMRTGYGVLTGEQQVRSFHDSGEFHVAHGEALLLFSDGITPLLEDAGFLACIRDYSANGPTHQLHESLSRVSGRMSTSGAREFRDDKTLVVVRSIGHHAASSHEGELE